MLMVSCVLIAHSLVGQIEAIEPTEQLPPLEAVEPELLEVPSAPAPALAVPELTVNPQFPPGVHAYVNASSLALRTGPKKTAGLIKFIKRDEVVLVLQDVVPPVPMNVGKKNGYWLYVQYNDHKGYVFDAFLAGAPPSLQDKLDLVCIPGKKVGPITSKTTYQDLALMVGEVNLALARIPLEKKGKFEEATAVFPGDKHKELIVQWDVLRVSPKAVIIHGSHWKTMSGIKIGARLEDVVATNKAPISFRGFGHQYGGYVTSWGGGVLSKTHPLRKSMLLYLEPEKPYSASDFEALQGEKEFSSTMEEVKRLNLKVSAMTIMLKK